MNAIGIDIGAATCKAAVWTDGGPKMIKLQGQNFMPTIVTFTHSNIIVGKRAKHASLINPVNTISGLKLIIGRNAKDVILKKYLKTVSFKTQNIDNKVHILVNYKGRNQLFSPLALLALILKVIKEEVELKLGIESMNCVLTIPTVFSDLQRETIKKAASLAGLNVLKMSSETKCIAISYGLNNILNDKDIHILVCDYGYSKFETSIIKVFDNTYEMIGSKCDFNLGSATIDMLLVNYCANHFFQQHKISIKTSPESIERLRVACCEAKEVLSEKNETLIYIPAVLNDLDLNIKISRTKLEDLSSDIFSKMIEFINDLIVSSNLTKIDLNKVIMAGSSSSIPKFHNLVREYFEKMYLLNNYNSHAVACGAAAEAAFLSGVRNEKFTNFSNIEISPYSIGLELSKNMVTCIISKGTQIPMQKLCELSNENVLTEVTTQVYEGDKVYTFNNNLIGALILSNLPSQSVKFKLLFELDKNGILNVSSDDIVVQFSKRQLYEQSALEEFNAMSNNINWQDIAQCREKLLSFINNKLKLIFSESNKKITFLQKLEVLEVVSETNDFLKNNPVVDAQEIEEKQKRIEKVLERYSKYEGETKMNFDLLYLFMFVTIIIIFLAFIFYI